MHCQKYHHIPDLWHLPMVLNAQQQKVSQDVALTNGAEHSLHRRKTYDSIESQQQNSL